MSELQAALKAARGGETIFLAPGMYPAFIISSLSFDKTVTITGAGALLHGVVVAECRGLRFLKLNFQGDPQENANGILIRRSREIVVENCEFQNLMHGIGHLASASVSIKGNKFFNIRSDGVRGGGSSRVSILGNHFSSFHPQMRADGKGDHPDAIQFWTTNTTVSAEDIVIQGNLIERGAGLTMQGVFLRDESGGDLPYIRPKVLDNVVIGGAWNGVTIGGGVDVEVARNICLAFPDEGCRVRVSRARGGSVRDNQASDFVFSDLSNVQLVRNAKLAAVKDGGAAFMKARARILRAQASGR
ncbi:right-handed parallel beta-helix repeat-containing protein [Phenylobacterium sp. Root700]|uniref:right-handed parallel beta-helix repeat-containing protein n=1 Tax=Phenylobacterium sp. Root700 TaxID=1736591 RepID=UPI00138F4C54|nr:right-handed parallel beta-helix repeat-containing protein [Phenylobacterium sp. Root700]